MTHFKNVRLINGRGWVSVALNRVTQPPDSENFEVAPMLGSDDAISLSVVIAGKPVAVLMPPLSSPGLSFSVAEAMAVKVLQHNGFSHVVWLGLEDRGAALAHSYSTAAEDLEVAGAVLWALKAMGGGDVTPVMTFLVTHVASVSHENGRAALESPRSSWLTATGNHQARGSVDISVLQVGGWKTLVDELVTGPDGECAVGVVDVRQLAAFNDAYGFSAGDLMLARVHSVIQGQSLTFKVLRVSGGGFAVVVPQGRSAAVQVMRRIEKKVADLRIPFEHAPLGISRWVEVKTAVDMSGDVQTLQHRMEEVLQRAG